MKGRFIFFLLLRRKQSAELVDMYDIWTANGTGNCDRVQLGIHCCSFIIIMEELLHTQGSASLSL